MGSYKINIYKIDDLGALCGDVFSIHEDFSDRDGINIVYYENIEHDFGLLAVVAPKGKLMCALRGIPEVEFLMNKWREEYHFTHDRFRELQGFLGPYFKRGLNQGFFSQFILGPYGDKGLLKKGGWSWPDEFQIEVYSGNRDKISILLNVIKSYIGKIGHLFLVDQCSDGREYDHDYFNYDFSIENDLSLFVGWSPDMSPDSSSYNSKVEGIVHNLKRMIKASDAVPVWRPNVSIKSMALPPINSPALDWRDKWSFNEFFIFSMRTYLYRKLAWPPIFYSLARRSSVEMYSADFFEGEVDLFRKKIASYDLPYDPVVEIQALFDHMHTTYGFLDFLKK